MISINRKQSYLVIILVFVFTSCAVNSWHSFYEEDPKYGEIHFENKLSEAFFRYTQNRKSFTSQNYVVNHGFVKYFEEPFKNSTYPGHPVTGVKFRIRLTRVEEDMFSKVIDTIVTDQTFWKTKHFYNYSEPEREALFEIDSCYLLDYSYHKAKYIFRLDGEVYRLKITKKINHPFLVRKLYSKEQLPERYLYLFFRKIHLNYLGSNIDYTYSMGFEGKDFLNKKGVVKTEFVND